MSGNSAFEMVSERGWRRGLGNMLDNEFAHWWGTRMWWVQCLIWIAVVGFFLGAVIFGSSTFQYSEAVMLYSIFAGLFPAVGVIIIMQNTIVGEKRDGTAAWVLSKPVSRPAFILSKLLANSLGVLVTMVLVPGLAAYALLSLASKAMLDPLHFLLAFGVIFLSHLFYLTFTLMLGTFFRGGGPVIGLALALLFLQQYLVGLLPVTRYLVPWTLVIPLNNTNNAVVPNLLQGQPAGSYTLIAAVAVEIVLFTLISVYRFNREEF
jgi:ABC-2 type transport system permease protein